MIKDKKQGRPRIKEGEDTLRVGFSVTGPLWRRFMAVADARKVSYSELFRTMLTAFLEGLDQ